MSDNQVLQQALSLLPHGAEFRFVDRLLELTPGREGTGEYHLKGLEPFLRGHFPGEPLMPGVLLTEAAAQLAGIVAQSDPAIPPLRGLKLTALRNVKLFGTARPGQTIHLHAQILGRLANLIQAQATARVEGRVVLTAELTLGGTADNVPG
jgi:3-hydroxyacyl-[acyl-carrier-protein] dehydratase